MTKPDKSVSMGAAECARRTGFTVRALRVYERHFRAAQAAAPWYQALTLVTEEAAKLMDEKVDPASAPAQALAKRLELICSDHPLGDALLYARSAPAMQFLKFSEINARETGTWAYLANTLRR